MYESDTDTQSLISSSTRKSVHDSKENVVRLTEHDMHKPSHVRKIYRSISESSLDESNNSKTQLEKSSSECILAREDSVFSREITSLAIARSRDADIREEHSASVGKLGGSLSSSEILSPELEMDQCNTQDSSLEGPHDSKDLCDVEDVHAECDR